MAPVSALVLLLAPLAFGDGGATGRLQDAAAVSQAAASAPDPDAAREGAALALEGGTPSGSVVDGSGAVRPAAPLARPTLHADLDRKGGPPQPDAKPEGGGPSKLLVLAGAGALGAMQGWFSAGLVGAAAGAGLGLAAAWLFQRKDYGGAFGVTAGAILGTAFGGPLGSAVGALVGGLVGHFLGKLFL